MKKIMLIMTLMPCLYLAQSFDGKKDFDKKLVGCWEGSEEGQQLQNVNKYWVSCRLDTGKSILLFVAVNPKTGAVMQSTENGTWWTSKGKYYEFHKDSGLTDVYNYQVSDDGGSIDFQSEFLIGKPNATYKFTDKKTDDL